MKDHIGKRVKIHIKLGESNLYFTAVVTSVSKTHISFTDKFNEEFTFKKEKVEEISSITS